LSGTCADNTLWACATVGGIATGVPCVGDACCTEGGGTGKFSGDACSAV
jgi:hypothetical protein